MDIAAEAKKAADKAWKNYGTVPEVLKADTKIIQGDNLVIKIKTLLNIISITL